MKSIILIISIYLNLFSNDFKSLDIQTKSQAKEFKNTTLFKDLSKNNKKNLKTMREQFLIQANMYSGNNFLTKEESKVVVKDTLTALDTLGKPKVFLLYFYSESVPKNSVSNFLLDVSILQSNGIDIQSKQYMVGAPEDYEGYMNDWKKYIESYPKKYQQDVSENFFMKLDPRFFTTYEINKVPAIALASCESIIPDPAKCRIKYLIHGDVPLTTFFDNISKIDSKYKNYTKFLDANGIFKAEVKK